MLAVPAGGVPALPFTPSDNGEHVVSLTVQDEDGGISTQQAALTVANAAPAATVPTANWIEAGPTYQLAGPLTVAGGAYSGQFTVAAGGVTTVAVTARDDAGGVTTVNAR